MVKTFLFCQMEGFPFEGSFDIKCGEARPIKNAGPPLTQVLLLSISPLASRNYMAVFKPRFHMVYLSKASTELHKLSKLT